MRNIAIWIILSMSSAPATGQWHDDFHHLAEVNKASLVMLAEEGIVGRPLAADIATGVVQVIEEQDAPDAARSGNYLAFEARLLELAGAEASRLHTGRSRQDIGSTLRRMALREALLDTYGALSDARRALLELASAHVDTLIPGYTHGVQAQPTSLAHYLLAFAAAFERDAERLQAAYARLNRSPLGAAAFATSGFALNRQRLAALLGFDNVVENSYDANLVSSVDSKIEFANALSASAVVVGQLMQNLHAQYRDTSPWILLAEETTDVSSIMPQKRNPRPLDAVRLLASAVVGSAHGVTINAHNTNSGMHDYRPATQTLLTASQARDMYTAYVEVVSNLAVDAERARLEIDGDYSTMTEVADVLLREAEVPFRIGHHYASELTSYGRSNGKAPGDLTDTELADIYRQAVGDELPVDVALIRSAMDPARMVRERKGLGGPQPAETRRMLARHEAALGEGVSWLAAARDRLSAAARGLESAFAALD